MSKLVTTKKEEKMETHNLTAYPDRPTSGRYVYRSGSTWYWQDDLCGVASAENYPTVQTAFQNALNHAMTCQHYNVR